MAALQTYTVQDLLDEIYVNVDNDPTSSTDNTQDEWTARVRLINSGIREWAKQDVYWNELWTPYTHGSTISASQAYVLTMTDFIFAGSFAAFTLNGNVTYVEIVKPEEAFKFANTGSRACYITGNNAVGWTLNLTWIPAVGDGVYYGATLSFNYYKAPLKMALATDKPEMRDPSFLISYVSYIKNAFNGRTTLAEIYQSAMEESMDNMRINNEVRVHYGGEEIEDNDLIRNSAALGL